MTFTGRHLLALEGLTAEEITFVIDQAESLKEISERAIKKVPALQGRTVVSLFYESSTRTRMSFEIAAKRMNADFVSLSATVSSSSKGETLLDTARNLVAMRPDCLILRHPAAGAAHFLAKRLDCPIINAGDGAHEHPTQALLDLLTIRDHVGRLTNLKVAIIGDILHSRVARSNIHALRALGNEIRLIGPPTFLPPEAKAWGNVCYDLDDGVRGADVIIMLRIQRERQGLNFFPSVEEYARLFCLTRNALALAAPKVVVLHPGPINRGIEIASDVADGPYSLVMDQVTNGVAVRMAVLYLLVTRTPAVTETQEAADVPRLQRSVG
jgi:aspartate carbamoyltransferase catalytic subunit